MDTESHFALLLIGQPTLRRQLQMAVNTALNQRIGTRYTIGPMNVEDTGDYIKGHLGFAGRSDPLFSEDAIAVIHQASRGYPRMVNSIALAALMATQAAKGAIVDQSAAQSAVVTEFSE
jgi:type II secretory pathway predicted ATPase ExeA